MTDIYITGSTGAIGSRILPKLEEKNFRVTQINLREPNNLAENDLPSENSWFIHLASQNSKMSETDIQTEKKLIKSAIDIAKSQGVANFIFFSSSKLYPATDDRNLSSENSDTLLSDPYSKGKMECELLAQASLENFKSVSIFRLAPVLLRSPSSNINLLFRMCEMLPFIPIFSEGNKNRRSFLSFKNLMHFLEVYLQRDLRGFNILNVCDHSPISTNSLINNFLEEYRPNVSRILLPKFIERFILSTPLIGKKLYSMYANNVIDNSKIYDEIPDLKLMETSEAIKSYGLD